MDRSNANPRQFKVRKDDGSVWDMIFGNQGVRWVQTKEPFDKNGSNPGFRPNLGAALPYVQALTGIADTAAGIGFWWETRQQRLMSEATSDETKRISWLGDMVARWGEMHSEGDVLDLRVSEYLARETREMMDVIVSNRRVALPQSMLYELEMIQDSLRSFRSLMLAQFERLFSGSDFDLDALVRRAIPTGSLDMSYIRSLGRDPSIEWAERVRTKTTGDFERELTETLRHPSAFLGRVFPGAIPPPADKDRDPEKQQGFLERLIGLVSPALPRLFPSEIKSDASERRDAFRELSLLPAEVARVKALNSAWMATSAIVASGTGSDLRVQVRGQGVDIGLTPAGSPVELESTRSSSE